ncbi:MAG: hypothetical protein GXP40_11720 [Chloroflexi bacterium]|nr:hypothetical protein [Chloroflexota bacterium]
MFAVLLLVVLGSIAVIALFAALTLLIPAPVEKTRLNLEAALGRSLLLGLVNFIFFAVLTALFTWIAQETSGLVAGISIFLAGVIVLALSLFTLLGLVALANLLGARMDGSKTPFTSHLRGGALLILAGLAPYVGWFVFTPLAAWAGLGAAISAIVRKKDEPEEEAA